MFFKLHCCRKVPLLRNIFIYKEDKLNKMDFNLIVLSQIDGLKTADINAVVKRAYDLGYECVAINTIIDSSKLSGKDAKIPEPKQISFEGKFGRKFRILNRLTAIIEDTSHTHHLTKSLVTKKYDILAVQPVGEKILQHVYAAVDADIICLNLSENLGFTLKRSHVGLAFQKGICFEISYAPCLRSESCRRSIISNAQLLVDVCRSKNIIISSGAMKPLELRSPHDIINLGLLFGFKTNQAVDAVRNAGHTVLSHAGTQRDTGCGFVSITGCLKVPKQQGWIVKMCKVPKLTEQTVSLSKKRSVTDTGESDSKKKKS